MSRRFLGGGSQSLRANKALVRVRDGRFDEFFAAARKGLRASTMFGCGLPRCAVSPICNRQYVERFQCFVVSPPCVPITAMRIFSLGDSPARAGRPALNAAMPLANVAVCLRKRRRVREVSMMNLVLMVEPILLRSYPPEQNSRGKRLLAPRALARLCNLRHSAVLCCSK